MVCLSSQGAMAAPSSKVVIKVDGEGGEPFNAQISSALPSGVEAIDAPQLSDQLSEQGLADLPAAIGDADGRAALIKKLRDIARASGAGGFISATVSREGHPGGLHLFVVLATKDDATLDETLPLNKKGAAPPRRLRELLGGALAGLRNEEASADEAGQDGTDAGEASTEAAASGQAGGPLTATDAFAVGFLGLDLGGRQFHYNQRVTNANLRPYDLPSGLLLPETPGMALSLELYPLARSAWPVVRDIGFTGHFGFNFAKAQLGTVVLNTSWYVWDVNLRGRIQLGARGTSPVVGIEAGLGDEAFSFKGDATSADHLPGVDYRYVRVGADGRMPEGRWALLAGAGFRHLLTTTNAMGESIPAAGPLANHFPRATIAGLDARVGASLSLTGNIEARLVVAYTRYWAAFHSQPSDTYIAGGATDQMMNADIGIAAFF